MYSPEEIASSKWTKAKIAALEAAVDNHIDNCDECQERLEEPPPEDTELPYYCPIGESLEEEYLEASAQWSWQPDFDPDEAV